MLEQSGNTALVNCKEVISGCCCRRLQLWLETVMRSASNNTGPRWRCTGGEAVSSEGRGELLLGARQARAGIRQRGPNQPDRTAINPTRGGGRGARGWRSLVADLDHPAVATPSVRGRGGPPPGGWSRLPGGRGGRMTSLNKRRGEARSSQHGG